MKKILLIASILTLVFFAFAGTPRDMYWEIKTVSPAPDIYDIVTNNLPTHNADFLLEVECSAYPGEIYRSSDGSPMSPQVGKIYGYPVMRVDQQPWLLDWPAGSIISFTLTYLPTEQTMTASVVAPDGYDAIFFGDLFGPTVESLDISAIILGDEPPVPDIYNYYLTLNVDEGEYAAGAKKRALWEIEGPDGVYQVNAGVLSEVEALDLEEDDVNPLIGEYTIEAAPAGWHWEPSVTQEALEAGFELDAPARDGEVFNYVHETLTWTLVQDIPENTYWLRILSMGLDEPGTLLKDGEVIGTTPYMPANSTDKSDFYGVYTMQAVAGGTWAPAELVIDENTEWPAIPGMDDNYQIMHTFEWTLDIPEPEPMYTLILHTIPEGYIESPEPSEDPEDLWGTYIPDPLPAPATGYWVPAELVIDENTEWVEDEDGDYYFEMEFVWEETEEIIDIYHYTLFVEADDGGNYPVTGPFAGTTPYDMEQDNKEAFYGDYTIGDAPAGCYWLNPVITIDEDFEWTAVTGGKGEVEVHHYFEATITFERKDYNSYVIIAVDGDTDERIPGVAVWFDDGEGPVQVGTTGASGAVTFLCPGNYPGAGTYWLEMEGYCAWEPESVVRTEEFLTENLLDEFYGYICGEPPVPVELSSFTATVNAVNNVELNWVSQSESHMVGYRVLRSEAADQSGSITITPVIIPATNTSSAQSYNLTDNSVEIGQTYHYWLEAVDYLGSNFHGPVSVTVAGNVPPVLPEVTTMKNAYPNPFKAGGSTNIEVALKAGENGTLTIYNVMGQIVKTVSLNEGSHMITWNGRDSRGTAVGSGIYFYKLSTPSLNQTKKMVIVK